MAGRRARRAVDEDVDEEEDEDAEPVVRERGSWGVGVAGRGDVVDCFQEGWNREKKLGKSGDNGEEAVVEAGEVEVEVEVDVEAEGEGL